MIIEAIDREYRVAPTQEKLFAARQRAQALSSAARELLSGKLGVPYGQTADEYADVFLSRRNKAPVFVFFHGGFWRAMSARDYSYVAQGPCAAEFLTISVNYGLAPKVALEDIVQQAKNALAWIVRNAERFNGDADQIVLGGHSAGAQLAAMCLLEDTQHDCWDPGCIKGALLVSGLYDLAPLEHTFVQADLQFNESRIHRNSPVRAIRRVNGRVLLTVGGKESDSFKRQSIEFQRALTSASTACDLEYIPEADHFAALEPLLTAESAMCRWLRRRVDG